MEPEQCLLAETVFLGAIVVTDDSKSEKKNGTQEEQETMGRTKTGGGKKNGHHGYLKRLEYESLRRGEWSFVAAKTCYAAAKCGSLR